MYTWKSPPWVGRRFPRTSRSGDGLGDCQMDTSGIVDADPVQEAETSPEERLEVCVGSGVRVAVLAVPPGSVDVWRPPTVTSARSLFTLLGHDGLPVSRGWSRSARWALDDYNIIIY